MVYWCYRWHIDTINRLFIGDINCSSVISMACQSYQWVIDIVNALQIVSMSLSIFYQYDWWFIDIIDGLSTVYWCYWWYIDTINNLSILSMIINTVNGLSIILMDYHGCRLSIDVINWWSILSMAPIYESLVIWASNNMECEWKKTPDFGQQGWFERYKNGKNTIF